MPEGAGVGYNIPISVSRAQSFSVPQEQAAGTVFNFSSPGASGDWYSQGQRSETPTTATSSAAQRDANATTGAVSTGGGGGNSLLPAVGAILGGIALLVVLIKH